MTRTLELSTDVVLEQRVLLAVNWSAQGPTPITGGQVEGMAAQSNPVAGAVHTVLAHPSDPNTLWVGSVNGGVWKTGNASAASPSWTPLTDYLPNQSIGALVLDPTDGSNNTILAGYGNNSSLGLSSGALQGVIRSTDGGTSWAQLGTTFFNGQGITGLAARGGVVLVATSPYGSVIGQVSRSTDTGLTWSNVSGTGGLPAGAAFDLAEDLTSLGRFYVSTTTGIYKTTDSGVNWTDITPAGSLIGGATNNIEMSVGKTTGSLFVAVVNDGRVASMWRSTNQGTTWQQLDIPEVVETTANNVTGATNASPIVITCVNHGQNTNDRVRITAVTGNTAANGDWTITRLSANTFSLNGSVGNGAYAGGGSMQALQGLQPREHPGSQGIIHLSILADPTNADLVYVGGDRQPLNNGALSGGFPNAIGATNFTGRLFRGNASLAPGSQWTPLTHNFADSDGVGVGLPGTAPHADSRDMAFDAAGNLIEVDDGGVYKRSSPTSSTGVWTSLNGNIQVMEVYDGGLSYDPLNNILVAGGQDVGSSQQSAAGSAIWNTLNQGDGSQTQSADLGGGLSVRYASSQFLGGGPGGFHRRTYDAANTLISDVGVGLFVVGFGDLFLSDGSIQFVTPYRLNSVIPTKMVIGTGALYESSTGGDLLTRLLAPRAGDFSRSLAYGGPGNIDLLWYGGNHFDRELMVRTAGAAAPTLVTTFPGFFTRDIAVGSLSSSVAYVIDFGGVIYKTIDAGATAGGWTDITGNFGALDIAGGARKVAAVTISTGGPPRDLVLVGGTRGVYAMDTATPGVWFELGTGLPNTLVNDIRYSTADDLLYTGTQGRGVWTIGSFTTTLAADTAPPTVLVTPVVPNPRNTGNPFVSIVFSEPVNGFDLADLLLDRNGGNIPLNLASQTLSTANLTSWTLANLAGITALPGIYTLTVVASASGIKDGAGNPLGANASTSWTVDTTAPTVDIIDVTPDPRSTPVGAISIVFTEAVSGFVLGDLSLTRNGGANLLTGAQTLTTGDSITFSLNNLTGLTTPAGSYVLTLTAPGGITDLAGNPLAGGAFDAFTVQTTLIVTSVTATPSGVVVSFNMPIDPVPLNLYDNAAGLLGPADLTLVGSGGAVKGSLVVAPDNLSVSFVATGGLLPPDTYTLNLRSAANGFKDSGGGLLDGDANGTDGDNYSAPIAAGGSDIYVFFPDFARGPGQPVDVPATSTGLPLAISDGTGVTGVTLRINYLPSLLTLTSVALGPDAPGGATVNLDTTIPGFALLTYSGPALPAGIARFASLTASVPTTAPYGSKQVLTFTSLSVNAAAIPTLADPAVHVVGYFGDASGNGTISALDAAFTNRIAASIDTGFVAYQLADPTIIADINGSGNISALDAALVNRFAASIPTPEIPPIPTGLSLTPAGLDPKISLPKNLIVRPGEALSVPVRIENTDVVPVGLEAFDLAIRLDPRAFRVKSVRSLGYDVTWSFDQKTGLLMITAARPGGPVTMVPGESGMLAQIELVARVGAPEGSRSLNLLGSVRANGADRKTALNEGKLVLIPAPTNAENDEVDGRVMIAKARQTVPAALGAAGVPLLLVPQAETPFATRPMETLTRRGKRSTGR